MAADSSREGLEAGEVHPRPRPDLSSAPRGSPGRPHRFVPGDAALKEGEVAASVLAPTDAALAAAAVQENGAAAVIW